MRRFNIALLAAAQLVTGRNNGFSIHDDLVAYPQYEIVFSESFISEHEAQALLGGANPHATYAADFSSQSDIAQNIHEATHDNPVHSPDNRDDIPETYEVMHFAPQRYLCAIPVLETPESQNETASELAKQEEARELARASTAGWYLLNESLEGKCLYFMSGWWSYSFCYNRQIVQFHALPMVANGKPPVRDPNTLEFVLGRAPKDAKKQSGQGHQQDGDSNPDSEGSEPPTTTDLQIKGDQRYLVQRLDGGTICDLTGRERTIEVQYHCAPGLKNDRIGWIKEVTTCAYLMVVNTPRLCDDVAFQPPRSSSANPISCRLILDTDDPTAAAEWHRLKTLEAEAAMGGPPPEEEKQEREGNEAQTEGDGEEQKEGTQETQEEEHIVHEGDDGAEAEYSVLDANGFRKLPPRSDDAPVIVGGVVVGGRNVLGGSSGDGKQPTVLKPPDSYLPNRANARQPVGKVMDQVTVLAIQQADEDGGEYWALSNEDLDALDLDPLLMDQMADEMDRQAQGKGWRLEMAEMPDGERELRGYVDGDEDDVGDQKQGANNGKPHEQGEGGQGVPEGQDEGRGREEDEHGSQEQFYGRDW